MSIGYEDNFVSATTIPNNTDYFFAEIFFLCMGLIDASNLILPATALTNGCYYSMFERCGKLTGVPELPATTLVQNCYKNMFTDCEKLNYVKCLATDISASNCTSNWLDGVASSGTFVKAAGMNGWPTGTSGIPENWTVQDAS